MYLATVRTRTGGKEYRYLRLMECYREEGEIKQRVIAHLGNLDTMRAGQLAALTRGFAKISGERLFTPEELKAKCALHYGDVLVIRRIWDELRIGEIIKESTSGRKIEFDPALTTLVMVLNRLINPASKLGTTRWQRKIYLPELESRPLKYQYFWRTLDLLHEAKKSIENRLFNRLVDLFSVDLNLVFYDTTSTYFEGEGKDEMVTFGHSRDRRSDKKQIVIGLVTTDKGIPIGHEVYPGNQADAKTIKQTLETIKGQFSIKRCIFVCDRGMVSQENLELLEDEGYEYIVGVRLRKIREIAEKVVGRPGKFKKIDENLRVKEVILSEGSAYGGKDKRYILCLNPKEAEKDKHLRDELVEKLKEELVSLQDKRCNKRICAILKHPTKGRYVRRTKGGEIKIDQRRVREDVRFDGRYVLLTNNRQLLAQEVVRSYKELSRIEDAFKTMKGLLKIRPIYHWTCQRIKAHVHVCVLAYTIERILEEKLKSAKLRMTAKTALDHLEEIRLIENELGGKKIRTVIEVKNFGKKILGAVGMKHIENIILS